MITPWSQGSALISSGNATFTRATCRTSGSVGASEQRGTNERRAKRSRRAGSGAGGQERRRGLEAAVELDLGNFISASNTDLQTRLFLGAEGADPAPRERYGYVGNLDPVWSGEVAVPQRAINRGPGQ